MEDEHCIVYNLRSIIMAEIMAQCNISTYYIGH